MYSVLLVLNNLTLTLNSFQELDRRWMLYIFNVSSKEKPWTTAVRNSLPKDVRYKKVYLVSLQI